MMNRKIRFIAIILFIAAIISACAPAPQPTTVPSATPQPTATSTPTPTPSSTRTSTSTTTPIQPTKTATMMQIISGIELELSSGQMIPEGLFILATDHYSLSIFEADTFNDVTHVLYEVPIYLTLGEAIEKNLIKSEGAANIIDFFEEWPDPRYSTTDEIELEISLYRITKNSKLNFISWDERISYCPGNYCIDGGSILKTMDLTTHEIHQYEPPLSLDPGWNIAWDTNGYFTVYYNTSTGHYLDRLTDILVQFDTMADTVVVLGMGGEFSLAPDGVDGLVRIDEYGDISGYSYERGYWKILSSDWGEFYSLYWATENTLYFTVIDPNTRNKEIYKMNLVTGEISPVYVPDDNTTITYTSLDQWVSVQTKVDDQVINAFYSIETSEYFIIPPIILEKENTIQTWSDSMNKVLFYQWNDLETADYYIVDLDTKLVHEAEIPNLEDGTSFFDNVVHIFDMEW